MYYLDFITFAPMEKSKAVNDRVHKLSIFSWLAIVRTTYAAKK